MKQPLRGVEENFEAGLCKNLPPRETSNDDGGHKRGGRTDRKGHRPHRKRQEGGRNRKDSLKDYHSDLITLLLKSSLERPQRRKRGETPIRTKADKDTSEGRYRPLQGLLEPYDLLELRI